MCDFLYRDLSVGVRPGVKQRTDDVAMTSINGVCQRHLRPCAFLAFVGIQQNLYDVGPTCLCGNKEGR